MNELKLDNQFESRKLKVLSALQLDPNTDNPDKSPKGFIDEPIIELISCINGTDKYYTTSSCSGRISLFLQENKIKQKGGEWLMISHNYINHHSIENAINSYKNKILQQNNTPNVSISNFMEISLKFEPFILHIECKDIDSAKQLLTVSRQTGLRESGINAISNRIMLRITFNLKLEVPLFYGDKKQIKCDENEEFILPNIHKKYVEMLTNIANNKMKHNLSKIKLFYQQFKSRFYPSFKWYSSYKNQPQLLSKQISNKMDLLFQKMEIIKESLSKCKYSETLSIINRVKF